MPNRLAGVASQVQTTTVPGKVPGRNDEFDPGTTGRLIPAPQLPFPNPAPTGYYNYTTLNTGCTSTDWNSYIGGCIVVLGEVSLAYVGSAPMEPTPGPSFTPEPITLSGLTGSVASASGIAVTTVAFSPELYQYTWLYPFGTTSCTTSYTTSCKLAIAIWDPNLYPHTGGLTTGPFAFSASYTSTLGGATPNPVSTISFSIGVNVNITPTPAPTPTPTVTPGVAITSDDIRQNKILVVTSGTSSSGTLTVTANYNAATGIPPAPGPSATATTLLQQSVGATSTTVQFYQNVAATDLPLGGYTKLSAKWSLNGKVVSANKSLAFIALGNYRQTQYNFPEESQCPANPLTAVNLWTSSCSKTAGTYREQFRSQVTLNGTGVPIAGGYCQNEAFCVKGPTGYDFRYPTTPTNSCNTTQLNNSTVAVGGDPTMSTNLLRCGDAVLIVNYRPSTYVGTLKSVTDTCKACNAQSHIDNFTTNGACDSNSVGDLGTGNYVTIVLGRNH